MSSSKFDLIQSGKCLDPVITPEGFDLLEQILLINDEEDRKNALGSIRLLVDHFIFENTSKRKILEWMVPTWNYCFLLEDLDWCHFLLFSMLISVDQVYSVFCKLGNMKKLSIFAPKLEKTLLALRKGYPVDSTSSTFKASEVRNDVREFVWDLRTFYLTL